MIRKFKLVVLFVFLSSMLVADPPDPDGPGSGGGPLPGGGAPIGGGSIVLMALATVYGLRKTHQLSLNENFDK